MKHVTDETKHIPLEELKELQMEILDAIDVFCNNNRIVYSLASGTLLGAVRHKGYIPWDDDIDIYMLRDNYIRFISVFPKLLNGKFRLKSLERTPKWHNGFAKIENIFTDSIDSSMHTVSLGVNIDVFPIDDVPEDADEYKSFIKKIRILRRIKTIKFMHIREEWSFLKIFYYWALKLMLMPVPARYIMNTFNKKIQSHNNKGYHSVFECTLGYGRRPFSKQLFSDISSFQFEDRKYKGFTFYDDYLKSMYGNYMQLPPENERVGHFTTKYYWKE